MTVPYASIGIGRYIAVALCVLVGSEVARLARVFDSPLGFFASTDGIVDVRYARDNGTSISAEAEAANRLVDGAARTDSLILSNLERIRPRPRNARIVLVGDSVTRYQYLSLVYFLRFGSWSDPVVSDHQPTPVYSHSYHHVKHGALDFAEFFYQTNRLLYPNEICDCQRYANFTLERRYFYDPVRDNKVVFINLNGIEPTDPGNNLVKARYFGGMESPETLFANFSHLLEREFQPSRVFRQKRLVAWRANNWTDVLLRHVSNLDMNDRHQPTGPAVFLNAGLHPHDLTPEDFAPLASTAAAAPSSSTLTTSNSPSSSTSSSPQLWRWIWKTTTYTRQQVVLKDDGRARAGTASYHAVNDKAISAEERTRIDAQDQLLCSNSSFLECWNLSWTRRICQSLFWDDLHYREPVYRILNEHMLQELRLLPPGYDRIDPRRVLC